VLGKTTRCAEDEGEAAGSFKARAASNRIGRAKPKEAAHRDVDYKEYNPSPLGKESWFDLRLFTIEHHITLT